MKIIVDAMGGDNAPQAPVMGAVQANREYGCGYHPGGAGGGHPEGAGGKRHPGAARRRGDCPRQRGGGDVRQPGHRLPGEEGLLPDGGAQPAQGRAAETPLSPPAPPAPCWPPPPCWSSASGASAGPPWPLWCPRGTAARCSSTAAPTPSVPLSI